MELVDDARALTVAAARSEPDPGLPACFLHHHADTVVLADRDARPDRTPHA
ncbi:MAG: hypothetical protein LC798_04985 [Chloroflexi bacterium]|nr:hypothetical protein [Chloroflexota bacterium]